VFAASHRWVRLIGSGECCTCLLTREYSYTRDKEQVDRNLKLRSVIVVPVRSCKSTHKIKGTYDYKVDNEIKFHYKDRKTMDVVNKRYTVLKEVRVLPSQVILTVTVVTKKIDDRKGITMILCAKALENMENAKRVMQSAKRNAKFV